MINILTTFGLSVLAFYAFYRYNFQQNEFYKQHLYGMLEWFSVYLVSALVVIYMANLVAKEVSIPISPLPGLLLIANYICSLHLQGKATFQVVHSIINCCTDKDITFAASKLTE